jgi:hypothetical protein
MAKKASASRPNTKPIRYNNIRATNHIIGYDRINAHFDLGR